MKKLKIEIEGQLREGTVAAGADGTLWVHLDGETFAHVAQRRSGRKGSRGSASVNPGEVPAPMPGKIIKVMVQKDQTVKAGEVLLVMEAMKMEYTLKAQADGQVAEIRCQTGEQVPLGKILVKLNA